jgi:SAM-dependent methyltransferase
VFVTLADPRFESVVLYTEWNAFGRTDVVEQSDAPDQLQVWLDGDVPALMRRFDGTPATARGLRSHPSFLPYRLRKIRRVLSLGAGAGFDVLLAKEGGAEVVDAVEINPAMPRVMERFRTFHGGVYDRPGVRLHVTDGRSFVKQTAERYDLIVLSLTQSATSGGLGTALLESHIHTREACRDYIRRLQDDGMVLFVGGYLFHAYRWLLTSALALAEETKQDLSAVMRHLLLLEKRDAAPYQYLVLLSRTPFDPGELGPVRSLADAPGTVLHFVPGLAESQPFSLLTRDGGDAAAFVDFFRTESKADVAPVGDDSPFFIDVSLRLPLPLWQLLGFAAAVTLLFAAFAAAGSRSWRRGHALGRGGLLCVTAYFSCLGIGFMLVEVGLIQRLILLLGSPTHTLALIFFSLLLGGAAGSAVSQRFSEHRVRSRSTAACLVVAAAALALGLALSPLAEALLGAGLAARATAAFVLCAGLGAAMGIPFPAGLRLVARSGEAAIPYCWGVNGVTSVVGSVLAAIGGRTAGFSRAVMAGALVYAIAAACLLCLRRFHKE